LAVLHIYISRCAVSADKEKTTDEITTGEAVRLTCTMSLIEKC